MLKWLLASVIVAALAGTAQAAGGLESAKAGHAAQSRGELDRAIQLYGQALASPDLSIEDRAIIFNNRGIAYWTKGDLDRAIQDYSTALELEPGYVAAYQNRGLAYRDQGQSDKEIADYDTAIHLQADDAFAYANRGRARLHLGQTKGAVEDLSRAVELDPQDPYGVLWLHLARTFGHEDDAIEFSRNAGRLDRSKWPGPILDVYLGVATPDAVRTLAGVTADEQTRREHVCEADFYIGAYRLLRGTREEARNLFRAAEHICPRYFLESEAARAELKRLGP